MEAAGPSCTRPRNLRVMMSVWQNQGARQPMKLANSGSKGQIRFRMPCGSWVYAATLSAYPMETEKCGYLTSFCS
tara:strand:+ start:4413 stop:4637 length:225 start_codon:yes stop_codon:yes gene_type:complete